VRPLAIVLLAAAVAVPVALAGPKDPTKRHTAADTRVARSIALRLGDFGAGWKQVKAADGNAAPDCRAHPNESKLIETADVDPTFDSPNGGAVTVDSDVSFFKTKAMALADWRTARLSLLRTCLAELLTKSLGKTAKVAVARNVPVKARAERTLGFHFEFTANGITVTTDVIGLGKNRTTVMLTVLGLKGSYNRAALDPLAALVAKRLSASA
jgi:hypothetical protein